MIMRRQENSLLAIFAIPAAIAALSTLGLVAALIGNDFLDVLSWIGLAAPLAAAGVAWSRRS